MGWVSPVPETRPVALYWLFDAGGDVLYIGTTWNPVQRFRGHKSVKSWWPEVARREVLWMESREAAEDAEKVAIALDQPRYNTRHMGLPTVLCGREAWVAFRDGQDLTLASYECAPAEA